MSPPNIKLFDRLILTYIIYTYNKFSYTKMRRTRMKHLGEVFKKFRESRHLTQKAVGGKEISVAQLSKFENGSSDITLSKFYLLLERIGITSQEFEYVANDYEFNHFYSLLDKIDEFYNNNNRYGLMKLLEEEDELMREGKQQKLNLLIIKSALRQIDKETEFTETEIEMVSDYLFSIEDWTYYELILYANTMSNLPLELINTLSKEALVRASFYKSIKRNRDLITTVIINTIIVFTNHKMLDRAIYFKNELRRLLTDETEIFDKTLLLFVTGAIYFYKGKEESGKQKMRDAIDIFNKVESYHLAESYEESYYEIVGERC